MAFGTTGEAGCSGFGRSGAGFSKLNAGGGGGCGSCFSSGGGGSGCALLEGCLLSCQDTQQSPLQPRPPRDSSFNKLRTVSSSCQAAKRQLHVLCQAARCGLTRVGGPTSFSTGLKKLEAGFGAASGAGGGVAGFCGPSLGFKNCPKDGIGGVSGCVLLSVGSLVSGFCRQTALPVNQSCRLQGRASLADV